MNRYIDADLLKKSIPNTKMDEFENCRYCRLLDEEQVKDLIDAQPTADVRENVKGEWIKEIKHYKDDEQEYDYYDIYCSSCGGKPEKAWHLTDYCPNCGADMRGEA